MSTGAVGSNLRRRVVSAIVLGLLVLGITYVGGLAFRALMVAMGALVFHEWTAMRPAPGVHRIVAWAALAVALAALLAGLPAWQVLAAVALAAVVVFGHGALSGAGSWSAAGIAYAALPAAALAFLRGADAAGLLAVLFLFAVVWATDILAYFTGRAFGGPKLAPAISPGKTWSGAVGGAVGGMAAGVAVAWLAGSSVLFVVAALALLLSAFSQMGDLFESAVKRRHGVKDSGTLIPGHGGVMDRVDALVAAALLLYMLGAVLWGPDTPAAGFFYW